MTTTKTTAAPQAKQPGALDGYTRPWRIALVMEDKQAIRLAAAYYALPKAKRGNLELLGAVAGIDKGVQTILTRLEVAGMLDSDEPPTVLVTLLANLVNNAVSRR